MKRVHSSESLAEVAHFKNVLEQHGIACMLKHEQLSGALGEIPFLDCLPELWILDDDDEARALRLIAQQSEAVPGPAWDCPACGEENERQFAACWRCGAVDAQH
jgi:hypothetical protein